MLTSCNPGKNIKKVPRAMRGGLSFRHYRLEEMEHSNNRSKER